MFSKVMSLGLLVSLLVSVPAFAGKHDERDRDEKCCYNKHKHDEKCCNDRHDRDEKCSLTGAYTAQMTKSGTQDDFAVVQFNDDGTLVISDTLGTTSLGGTNLFSTIYTGTWKCVGNRCFTFCATSILVMPATPKNIAYRTKVSGTICFDPTCQMGTSTGDFTLTFYAITDLTLKNPLTTPPQLDLGTLVIQRLAC